MSPEFQVGEASPEDLDHVRLWFNPGRLSEHQIPNPNATNFVAKRKSRIIGFVQLVYHPPEHHPYVGYWLFSLDVRSRWRGFGIGEALSQALVERAEAKGASEVLLLVHNDNKPAIGLYRKLGFRERAIPALDSKLEEEYRTSGRRRIIMSVTFPEK